jgi:iron complex transport system ATP-binding protein
LRELSFGLDRGLVAIVGPNGAGKSTLLSVMAGLREGYTGSCLYKDRELGSWARRLFAREVAVVPQAVHVEFPFTAEQVVLMGRTPYANGLFEAPDDHTAVQDAMRETDTLAFRDRDFRQLSGGERQRVVLASALAQRPETLLLDEPTTFLDISHQIGTYRLLRRLTTERDMLVVAVTHDLNLALTFADRVLVLRDGALQADGAARDVFTPGRLREVFAIEAQIQMMGDRPWLAYDASERA